MQLERLEQPRIADFLEQPFRGRERLACRFRASACRVGSAQCGREQALQAHVAHVVQHAQCALVRRRGLIELAQLVMQRPQVATHVRLEQARARAAQLAFGALEVIHGFRVFALFLGEDREISFDHAGQNRVFELFQQGDGAAVQLAGFGQARLLQAQAANVLAQAGLEAPITAGRRVAHRALIEHERLLELALAVAQETEPGVGTRARVRLGACLELLQGDVVILLRFVEAAALLLDLTAIDAQLGRQRAIRGSLATRAGARQLGCAFIQESALAVRASAGARNARGQRRVEADVGPGAHFVQHLTVTLEGTALRQRGLEREHQLRPQRGVARVLGEAIVGRAQVLGLDAQPAQGKAGLLALRGLGLRVALRRVVLRVAQPDATKRGHFIELFGRVSANALVHTEPQVARSRRVGQRAQQGFVAQRLQRVERGRFEQSSAHELVGSRVEAGREHRAHAERQALIGRERLPGPVDRAAQRALTRLGVARAVAHQIEPRVHARKHAGNAQGAHARGTQLDRERNAFDRGQDLGQRARVVFRELDAGRARQEQRQRAALTQGFDVRGVGRGHGQGSELEGRFARDAQHLARGHEEARIGCEREPGGDGASARRHQLLEVVEYEQNPAARFQGVRDAHHQVPRASEAHAQQRANPGAQLFEAMCRTQIDEPTPWPSVQPGFLGVALGQAGLAHAWRPQNRHQAVPAFRKQNA